MLRPARVSSVDDTLQRTDECGHRAVRDRRRELDRDVWSSSVLDSDLRLGDDRELLERVRMLGVRDRAYQV